jgi:EAL domain-containing protein (putative c-di-GMP-specific phosphodiesterase class I)
MSDYTPVGQFHGFFGRAQDVAPAASSGSVHRRMRSHELIPERRFRPGGVALLDVEDLGGVNDDHGMDAGDALMAAIEARMSEALEGDARLMRLDGDRFLLWLPALSTGAARRETRRLIALAGRVELVLGGHRIRRDVQAGMAILGPTERRRDALVRAEGALRAAKECSDRIFVEAGPGDGPRGGPDRPSREEVLEALSSGDFAYHVQPIVALGRRRDEDRVCGVEALLRWQRPDGVVLLPDSFLGPLERTGAQMGLDPRLAVQVARNFVSPASGAPLGCAFNITGAVLDGSDRAGRRWIETLLEALPPAQLTFEIVESAVISRPDAAVALVTWLRALGARIALDDFGTGVSGLDRLRDLPVDVVKLDRSFTQALGQPDGRSEGILLGLAAMGRAMGFEVIAEGIESEATLETVRGLGVSKAQGFLLGRPGPAALWSDRLSLAGGGTAPRAVCEPAGT